jgi:hypothetical protein
MILVSEQKTNGRPRDVAAAGRSDKVWRAGPPGMTVGAPVRNGGWPYRL